MVDLLADRFISIGGAWLDLAGGSFVRLRVRAAGSRADQLAWSEMCARLSCLRHPMLNSLIDYGFCDRERTFEAYDVQPPLFATATVGGVVLTHAVRCLGSRGIELTADIAPFLIREFVRVGGARAKRGVNPLGVILQPRQALEQIAEAFVDPGAYGARSIAIAGAPGSGLRTLRMMAARVARVAGYLPVASSVLARLPDMPGRFVDRIAERTVCVLVDDGCSVERRIAAGVLARLAVCGVRPHIVLRFLRTRMRVPGALEIEPMSVNALTEMVYLDPDVGPSRDAIARAARVSDGLPGGFLNQLQGMQGEANGVRMAMVHESSPAYVVGEPPSTEGRAPTGIARRLLDAPERATRLASRGRHAAALRLLTRALRILEARGEHLLAATCAEALGWIERNRGRSDRALAAFSHARALGDGEPIGINATVGTGVVWTDQRQFVEGEAALRAACTAASLLNDAELSARAGCALARCLLWQGRGDEAMPHVAVALELDREDTRVIALGLAARLRLANGDLKEAVSAASEAARIADALGDPRAIATASKNMSLVQTSLGDADQVLFWTERGLRAAADAHLPIVALRLRALRARAIGGHEPATRLYIGHFRAALRDRPLPALVRAELEAACEPPRVAASVTFEDHALRDLGHLLELIYTAPDDQTGLDALCRHLCDRMKAVTVQIVAGGNGSKTVARAGRPWTGDSRAIERVLAGGPPLHVADSDEPRHAIEPVRHAQDPIAAVAARWTAGTALDSSRVTVWMRAAALAAAGPVRTVLDRDAISVDEQATGDLIGSSSAAQAVRENVFRAARAPFPVLIEGESGSGKELVARGIHRLSARRERRLSTVNCAALTDDLLEAELFGHARGAFTGAVGERAGLFEEADGGTLFLDEVGELSPRAQAKLLRVLQDGEVRRVGENFSRRVDTRIVAATNRRLEEEVAANRFRADLRFRLDVIRIAVPPLRERATDVPALAMHFWKEAAARVGSSASLTTETLAALARYDWPGNVRELQNVIASLAVHAPRRGRVPPSVLPGHIARCGADVRHTFESARHDFERRYVRAALAQAGGHRAKAARALGVSRQGLAKMMRRLRIEG